ncbi:MAG: hypothetical protein AAGD06_25605 [Acidobacteriota bacterium]
MSREVTVPGIGFTLKNNCDTAVRGLSLGNQQYTLQMGSWVASTPVFQGDLEPGEEVELLAAADFDGKAQLLFVQINCGSAAVTVSSGDTVSVPDRYCGCAGDAGPEQFKAR